jgi:hypothetical protein
MVADFFEVDEHTIERYLEKYADELQRNGYVLMRGKNLKNIKLAFATDINVGSKTTSMRCGKLDAASYPPVSLFRGI